jgi:hypothetical protein
MGLKLLLSGWDDVDVRDCLKDPSGVYIRMRSRGRPSQKITQFMIWNLSTVRRGGERSALPHIRKLKTSLRYCQKPSS